MDESLERSEPSSWLTGTIIVGVDGSPSSVDALRRACRLAELSGASVQAVAAWQPVSYGIWVVSEYVPVESAEVMLRGVVHDVFGDDIPGWFTGVLDEGAPAECLIRRSKDADLLVLGSRGRGGFAGMLLGSVSAACAQHAHCSVLVVHGAEVAHAPARSAGKGKKHA